MAAETEDTLSERIARILADRIISGDLPPGARLRQDHVAAEFGASHVPVREAFRALQVQGLAESEPWRGFRVTGFDVAELREVAEMRARAWKRWRSGMPPPTSPALCWTTPRR